MPGIITCTYYIGRALSYSPLHLKIKSSLLFIFMHWPPMIWYVNTSSQHSVLKDSVASSHINDHDYLNDHYRDVGQISAMIKLWLNPAHLTDSKRYITFRIFEHSVGHFGILAPKVHHDGPKFAYKGAGAPNSVDYSCPEVVRAVSSNVDV